MGTAITEQDPKTTTPRNHVPDFASTTAKEVFSASDPTLQAINVRIGASNTVKDASISAMAARSNFHIAAGQGHAGSPWMESSSTCRLLTRPWLHPITTCSHRWDTHWLSTTPLPTKTSANGSTNGSRQKSNNSSGKAFTNCMKDGKNV